MFRVGVILTAFALLFLLTTLAFGIAGQLRHPRLVAAGLIVVLVVGLLLLAE
jgi:hypothetical protein